MKGEKVELALTAAATCVRSPKERTLKERKRKRKDKERVGKREFGERLASSCGRSTCLWLRAAPCNSLWMWERILGEGERTEEEK